MSALYICQSMSYMSVKACPTCQALDLVGGAIDELLEVGEPHWRSDVRVRMSGSVGQMSGSGSGCHLVGGAVAEFLEVVQRLRFRVKALKRRGLLVWA